VSQQRQSASAHETEAIGAALAADLSPGDVVTIEGELGAGKTTLVRGACIALGVKALVTSPTFTIGQRYAGQVTVAHVDLFRVPNLSEEDPQLLDDYVGPELISFIELPLGDGDRRQEVGVAIGGLARIAARITIEHAGGDRRRLRIE
jgi:tRNA threonylcarbamoyladenosine biosynthesis protein TsaE